MNVANRNRGIVTINKNSIKVFFICVLINWNLITYVLGDISLWIFKREFAYKNVLNIAFLGISFAIVFIFSNRKYKLLSFSLLLLWLGMMLVAWGLDDRIQRIFVESLVDFIRCDVLIFCLFGYISSIEEIEKSYSFAIVMSVLCCILEIILGNSWQRISYMDFSNAVMLPSLIALSRWIYKKNYNYLIVFLVILFSLLLYGSRSVLITFALFLIIYLYINNKSKKVLVASIFLLICGILVVMNYKEIAKELYAFFPNSRTLYSLVYYKHTSDVRMQLYKEIGSEIIKNPFSIRGIYSDLFFNERLIAKGNIFGAYSHNFILEILFQNGIILGGIILSCIYGLLFRTVSVCKNKEGVDARIVVGSYVSYWVSNSMLSGSYLRNVYFALAIGISCFVLDKNRKTKL